MIFKMLQRIATVATNKSMLLLCLAVVGCEYIDAWYIDVHFQGASSFLCSRTDLPDVRGFRGMIIAAHRTDCHQGYFVTYVYLHSDTTPDRFDNLIFISSNEIVSMSWLDPDLVEITGYDTVSGDQKAVRLNGVDIVYSVRPRQSRPQ